MKIKKAQNGAEIEKDFTSTGKINSAKWIKNMQEYDKSVRKGDIPYNDIDRKRYMKELMSQMKSSRQTYLDSVINGNNNLVIEDDMGQWAHSGEITKINSNDITMKGVNYPVLGISNTGDIKMMKPGKDYKFKGSNVTEYPQNLKKQQYGGTVSTNGLQTFSQNTEAGFQKSMNNIQTKNYQTAGSVRTEIPKSNTKMQSFNNMGSMQAVGSAAGAIREGDDENGPSAGQKAVGSFGPWGAAISQVSQIGTNITNKSDNVAVGALGTAVLNPSATLTNKDLTTGEKLFMPAGAIKMAKIRIEKRKRAKDLDQLQKDAEASNAEIQDNRIYVRPEDQLVDPNQTSPSYGTGTNYLAQDGAYLEPIKSKNKGKKEIRHSAASYFIDENGTPIKNKYGATEHRGTITREQYLHSQANPDQYPNDHPLMNSFGVYQDMRKEFRDNSKLHSVDVGYLSESKLPQGMSINDKFTSTSGVGNTGDVVYRKIYNEDVIDLGSGPVYNPKPLELVEPTPARVPKKIVYDGKHLPKSIYKHDKNSGYRYNKDKPALGSITNKMQDGGLIEGDELTIYDGGHAEHISENPFLPNNGQTIMFRGNSHENGGIPINFSGANVEVEGGEPAVKLKDTNTGEDNLIIFGDMTIPKYGAMEIGDKKAQGKKFKNYINDLSKQEEKQNKIIDKTLKFINDKDVSTSYDKLTLSSGQAMLTGLNMKLREIADKKNIASSVQTSILDTAKELNLDSNALSKGKIKKASKDNKMAKMGDKLPIYQNSNDPLPSNTDLIPRSEVQKYIEQYGYELDPTNPNRLVKHSEAPGETTFHYVKNGVEYISGTEMAEPKTRTITDPGVKFDDYLNIYDPETPKQQNNKTLYNPDKLDWQDGVNAALPFLRPSNQKKLDPDQLAGERFALLNNALEPVKAQQYNPQLEQTYDLSLQDQINANQSDFNSVQRITSSNPAAQSMLSAQKYAANSAVLGQQFRLNQENKAGMFNRNRTTLNDAQLKNLAILDNQYVRQAQAKSNTKATTQAAINSISSKIQQNKLENRTLGVYENLYNYRFDNKGRAINWNGFAKFNSQNENLSVVDNNGKEITKEITENRGKWGTLESTQNKTKVKTKPKQNGGLVKSLKGF